jgi:hypothetical protein
MATPSASWHEERERKERRERGEREEREGEEIPTYLLVPTEYIVTKYNPTPAERKKGTTGTYGGVGHDVRGLAKSIGQSCYDSGLS